jgi:hypothetical protein
MTRFRTSQLAAAAALCALAAAPAALSAPRHQTPISHQTGKHAAAHAVTRGSLTTGAWTPMIDEPRTEAPFNRLVDYSDALARFLNRP